VKKKKRSTKKKKEETKSTEEEDNDYGDDFEVKYNNISHVQFTFIIVGI
jgi:hypothetical protein